MRILMILYKSAFGIERVKQLFRERSSNYSTVDGLRHKFYLHDPATDQIGGIYVFDAPEQLAAFRRSDLEKSIETAYRFVEPPTIREFDVPLAISDDTGATGAASARPAGAALLRRVVERGFNAGDVEALDDCYAPDYVDHQAGMAPPNRDGVKAFIKAARTAFPDLTLTIEESLAVGDKVLSRILARGTHTGPFMGVAPTGKTFSVARFDVFRLANGRFVEHWGVIDRLSLLQQIGAKVISGSTA